MMPAATIGPEVTTTLLSAFAYSGVQRDAGIAVPRANLVGPGGLLGVMLVRFVVRITHCVDWTCQDSHCPTMLQVL